MRFAITRSVIVGLVGVLAGAVVPTGAAVLAATSVETIGTSREQRPIRLVHTGSPDGVRILVVGCIHGNECAARALVTPLVRANLPVDLWIVPSLNPDGFVRASRQNAAGVDLNRNWPRWWRRSGRPWDTFYSGPRAASEPETRVGQALVERIRPQVTIWYHQHLDLVWASGTSIGTGRVYARVVEMGLRTDDTIRGTASGWQRSVYPDAAAFVVELPAGPMGRRAQARHVRAIRAVANALAG